MILDLSRPPVLETERLRLEALTESDAADLFAIMGDREVMAYWDASEIDDPEAVDAIVADQVGAMAGRRALHWSIRTLGERDFVGVCDLSGIDRKHRRAEVGFLLGRNAWREGYAQEALGSIVAFAAANGLRKLAARTHLGNRRSEALLEEFGFTLEGLLRGHVFRDGERRDCRLFGLLL